MGRASKTETVAVATERAIRSGAATMARMQTLADKLIKRHSEREDTTPAEDAAMLSALGDFIKDAGAGLSSMAAGLARLSNTDDKPKDEKDAKPVTVAELMTQLTGKKKL